MAKLESIQNSLQYWQKRYAKAEGEIERWKQNPYREHGLIPERIQKEKYQLILCKLRLMETISRLNTD